MNGLLPTMLFVPGSDQHKLARIPDIAASAFILDLEDAVAHSAKLTARIHVAECLRQVGGQRRLFVRINALDTLLWQDDLHAVVVPGVQGIVLPKVNAAEQVQAADAALTWLEQQRELPARSVAVIATIETVRGVRHVDAIASGSARLRGLCFGAGDFSLDVGLDWPPPGGRLSSTVIAAKVSLVLASREYGLAPPYDGVFPNFRDAEGLRAEALEAQSLGFFGKQAIHPAQLPIIDAVFRPTAAQIEQARRIVLAFEESERAGMAALHLEGQLVDYPVVARARQVLALAAGLDA